MTTASRISVRHAGDRSPEWLAEQERKAIERQDALDARIAASRERDPESAARIERQMRRRRR